jgi:hypothetical protein
LLSEHPDVAVKVREEVDRVIGDRAVTFEDIMEVSEGNATARDLIILY